MASDLTEDAHVSPVVEFFPVAIGYYADPALPDLDVEREVGRMLDLLAPFGVRHHRWMTPARERGAGPTQLRLFAWANGVDPDADGTVVGLLYWVGHGWSDGAWASLAHTESPARVGANGVTPEQFADHVRVRQAQADTWEADTWTIVVVDTCRSRRFVELVVSALKSRDPPLRVLLIGVSGDGATTLGRWTNALCTTLTITYKADDRIPALELAAQLYRLLPGCEIAPLGDLSDSALVPVYPPVASWLSAPLDTIQHLENVLDDLEPDQRRHFLVKAQGAGQGEPAWFFEGREAERQRIVTWLREAASGLLIVTGRAGSGKSALLGDVLIHSLPDLRDALARRGLIVALPPERTPPDDVFDVVIHLSGLSLRQIVARIAAAAGLSNPPTSGDSAFATAASLDWLTAGLAERTRPFTVLADALDEANEPMDTARALLSRIAAAPGVRVLVGTRASTHEAPDAPSDDTDLLDALTGYGNADQLWLPRDPEAVRRYVTRLLREVRDYGRAGIRVPNLDRVRDEDIDRVAVFVAGRNKEFLFARLAVYELIEDARLLMPARSASLSAFLEGDHQDVFAKAIDRLGQINDFYPVLLRALSLAQGRGLPEADGIWSIIASAFDSEIANASSELIPDFLAEAAAYVVVDHSTGHDVFLHPADEGGPSTVYRLAHRTFVEYFIRRSDEQWLQDQRRSASALIRTAAAIAVDERANMPAYLARHLSGHVAEADLWDELAASPQILDGLNPDAVTADALRTLFGRRDVPPAVAGVIGARERLSRAGRLDRAGLRQLASTAYGREPLLQEPAAPWGIAAADTGRATLHVSLWGHTSAVGGVCGFSLPDQRSVLASASDDGTIRIWDPVTATPLGTPLTGHASTVEDVCVLPSPTGRSWLASAGGDGTVQIWDPVAGSRIREIVTGHAGRVLRVCAIPHGDRTMLASAGDDGTVRVWDPYEGSAMGGPLTGHVGTVWGICCFTVGDRPLLATTGDDGQIRIWDPLAGALVCEPLTGHDGAVWSVCELQGNDVLIASAGYDGTVRIWDPLRGVQHGEPLIVSSAAVWGLCALPTQGNTGHLVATAGEDGAVRVWDPLTGTAIGPPLIGHEGAVWGVSALPQPDGDDRSLLASYGGDGTIRIWDPSVADDQAHRPRTDKANAIWAVCALPRNNNDGLVAAAADDGTIQIWDPDTGARYGAPLTGHSGRVWGLCSLSAWDGEAGKALLVSAGYDGTIRIWDPIAGTAVGGPMTGHTGAVWDVCTVPGDGGRPVLASAGEDGTIRFWDPMYRTPVGSPLAGHKGRVWALCVLPGERTLLASAGDDGTIRLWDLASRTLVGSPLTGHTGRVWALCVLPGERTLLVSAGYDGVVRLWDPVAGTPVGEPLTGHDGAVWSVYAMPQPDGADRPRLLVSTGYDGKIRLWNSETCTPFRQPLIGHAGTVHMVCPLPWRPQMLASAGEDGSVRIWDIGGGREVGAPMIASSTATESFAEPIADERGCVLVHGAGTVHRWCIADPALAEASAFLPPNATAAALADGRVLVVGDANGLLHALDLATGGLRPQSARVCASAVLAVTLLPGTGDPLIAAAGGDGRITLHTLDVDGVHDAGRPALLGSPEPVRSLCPVTIPGHPRLLASAGNDGAILVWDLDAWAPHGAGLPLTGHIGWIWSMTVLHGMEGDPLLLVSAGADHTVRLWDPRHGHQVGEPLAGHTDQVRAVACARADDGRALLVSGGHDGSIRLWDPYTGQPIHSIPLGIPCHALLQQPPDVSARDRNGGGATMYVGLRNGTLALDLAASLFPPRGRTGG